MGALLQGMALVGVPGTPAAVALAAAPGMPGAQAGAQAGAAAAGVKGWSMLAAAEAAGQQTPAEAVAAWLAGNAPLLLNPDFTEAGAAVAAGDRALFWQLVLSAPPPSAAGGAGAGDE